ncbi:MAG: NADH dehydrogenase-like protein [Gemmatimonadaceae bacterium]|nr:NADH dehydrogenase-like protein [Gemmatimonadaceae bacterium]
MPDRQRPRVAIVGGGFAGIAAARRLERANADVVVIDRTNHHLFQPLLYQVATATLSPSDIAVPIRWLLRGQRNTRVVLGAVSSIDRDRRVVHVEGAASEPYDYLILTTGSRHSYFGHGDWEPNAPGLKDLADALDIRHRFLSAFELAERSDTEEERAARLTFVVVGGGPTGVELAGIMATIAREALRSDFRRIDTRQTRVMLAEAGPRLLPAFPEALSTRAASDLMSMGVEVRTDTRVTQVLPDAVWFGKERVPTFTVLWAAGNEAQRLGAAVTDAVDRAGRVKVEADLSVPDYPNVFVAGDLAIVSRENGQQVPGVAPAAIQMGRCAGDNVLRSLRRQPRRPFRYVNKGELATIGRYRAAGVIAGVQVAGPFAWFVWLFVHIMYLAGFRNRLSVLFQWGWSYLTWQRGVRLIVDSERRAAASSKGKG